MEGIGNFLSDNFGGASKPAYKHLLIGGLCGFISGKIFVKASKLAAIAVSGSILVFYIVHRQGLITVDKEKMSDAVQKVKEKVKEKVDLKVGNLPDMEEVAEYGNDYKFVVVGYAGGFLFGVL